MIRCWMIAVRVHSDSWLGGATTLIVCGTNQFVLLKSSVTPASLAVAVVQLVPAQSAMPFPPALRSRSLIGTMDAVTWTFSSGARVSTTVYVPTTRFDGAAG